MPNFSATRYGLISRLSVHAASENILHYGVRNDGVYIDALPVHYGDALCRQNFLSYWPLHSPAHQSYFSRITDGPNYASPHALGFICAQSLCA